MSKSNDIIAAIPCRAGTQKHKEIMAHILTAISGGATGDYFTVHKLHGNVINAIKKYIDNLSETC